MYDILEVLFFHQPSADKRAALAGRIAPGSSDYRGE